MLLSRLNIHRGSGVTSVRRRLVIIGGGFTGALVAIHAIRATTGRLDVTIVEPEVELGRGIAYGTSDRNHRTNVPSDRMGLSAGDPTAATHWFLAKGVLPDEESEDGQGHSYPPRQAYGSFVAEVLRDTAAHAHPRATLRHQRSAAIRVTKAGENGAWQIACDDGAHLFADEVALCFGHAAPNAPCPITPDAGAHPKFVSNPWAARALAAVAPRDSVTVIGTGLTMADVVASLEAGGHKGLITAVSRRGLLPLAHGAFVSDLDILGGAGLPRKAIDLLRLVRRRAREMAPSVGWHPVVDSLRAILPDIWNALPAHEKRKVVRRILPFWEVHRFRIAPQIDAALRQARADGRLSIEKATAFGIGLDRSAFKTRLRRSDGAFADIRSDAVVLCTGPDRDLRKNPLIAALLANGFGRVDDAGLGLAVDRQSRLIDGQGRVLPNLWAFGPMTRGSFGEMTGAPDIALHIERVIGQLLQSFPGDKP